MKRPKQLVKAVLGKEAGKEDYRALIAFILTISFVGLLFLGKNQEASILGPLAGSAVTYYFMVGKRSG